MKPDAIGQSLNIQALQKKVLELWKQDQSSARELGKALISTRDAMRDAHGGFAQWFRESGLSENRVYYCIRLVEGKVERPGIPESPTAEYENALVSTLRHHVRERGLSMEKLQPHHITDLVWLLMNTFIGTLRDETGILDTNHQPPQLEEYLLNCRANLKGIVETMYVPEENRETLVEKHTGRRAA
jgi:hypothetical protein